MIASREYVKDLICKLFKSNNFRKVTNKYSEDEQIVGTWINGKPIYRKVIQNITAPQATKIGTTATKNVFIGTGIDNIVDLRYKVLFPSESVCDFGNFTSGGFDALFRIRAGYPTGKDAYISIISSHTNWNVANITVIVDYTKTID